MHTPFRAKRPRGGGATRPSDEMLLLGPRAVEQQLAADPQRLRQLRWARTAGQRVRQLAERAATLGVAVAEVEARSLDAASARRPHQGVAAVLRAFAYADFEGLLGQRPSLLVALDGVQDPQNLGAIVRTAWAMGADGVLLPRDRACAMTPAAARAAAGGHARVPIARVVNLARALRACSAAPMQVLGLAAEAEQPLATLPLSEPTVVVVGGEGGGLRPGVARACGGLAHLPMPGGAGALNVSVACGMALYEVARQRRPGPAGALTAPGGAPKRRAREPG